MHLTWGAVVLALSLTIAALATEAQQAGRTYRVGLLVNLPPPPAPVAVSFYHAFRAALREAGFIEGANLEVDVRWEKDIPRLAWHARQLIRSKPDVIVAYTTPATKAALDATRTIPIVFTMVSDPVGSGFVVSLSRPGGNATGVTNVFPETASKLLEHLREVMGRLGRVAVLWNPDNPGKVLDFKEITMAARVMSVDLTSYEVRSARDFQVTFDAIEHNRPDALITLVETTTFLHRKEIIDFAQKRHLPTAFNFTGHVEMGGLLSYSPDIPLLYHRTGALAAKVLLGERPAHLPVERPTRYQLAVNLKTAKALGLTIPPSLLLRADQVIE